MMNTQTATFAAGCFWGVEAAFRQVSGVIEVVSGYTGGHTEHPSYREVCGHSTGHAEAVQVTFDPQRVGFDRLLEEFWKIHDPTQLNRQGPDVGDQYRSAIFTHGDDQRAAAIASRDREQARHARPIATQIISATTFWPAEEYHQRYLEKHGMVQCHVPAR